MNLRDPATDLRALHALAKRVRDSVQPPPAAALARGQKRRVDRATGRRIWRATVHWSLAAVLAAVFVFVGMRLVSLLRPVPELLLYRIEGGSVLSGGYVQGFGGGGVRLFFDDGSTVALTPGARGRLQALETEGMRVIIEQGTASFDVARSKEHRWFVEAGPFSVAIKGTAFSISWEPVSERFELRLEQGTVVVSGPIASGGIVLRAGHRLLVDLPNAEALISETPADPSAAPSGRSLN